MSDTLFDFIERLQADRPWGRVLDAGTGAHSLAWIESLATDGWVAVTGDPREGRRLEARHPGGRLVVGNWTDEALLDGERFETVLADYLLGAIEGFAPHYQTRLFERLRPHVGGMLYAVGLAPYEPGPDGPAARIVRRIARLRDACILLGGGRCYREYPVDWVRHALVRSGYAIVESRSFPIRYGADFVGQQLRVGMRYLPSIENRGFARALAREIGRTRREALAFVRANDGLAFGEDWVVAARPTGPASS